MRYKIDMNAKQLRLHGVGLVTDEDSLLVLEGGMPHLIPLRSLVRVAYKCASQRFPAL
jgi:hypothetical protein